MRAARSGKNVVGILGVPRREDRAPWQALHREIEEELLCEINVAQEVCTSEYDYDFGTVRLTTFICHLVEGSPHLTEHTNIQWLAPADMPQLNWAPVDRETVAALVSDQSIIR